MVIKINDVRSCLFVRPKKDTPKDIIKVSQGQIQSQSQSQTESESESDRIRVRVKVKVIQS